MEALTLASGWIREDLWLDSETSRSLTYVGAAYPIIVDGRNLLNPEEICTLDLSYLCIERYDVIPNKLNCYSNAEAVG